MSEQIIKNFGERVKELRIERNLTQKQVADISGLHKNYIGMIERGERNPSLTNIYVLCRSFKVNLPELFKFDSNNPI